MTDKDKLTILRDLAKAEIADGLYDRVPPLKDDLLEAMAANPRSGSYMPPSVEDAEYWKRIAKEGMEAIYSLCNQAWGAVYGEEHKTEWEYPAQAIRHLVQAYRSLQDRLVESCIVDDL